MTRQRLACYVRRSTLPSNHISKPTNGTSVIASLSDTRFKMQFHHFILPFFYWVSERVSVCVWQSTFILFSIMFSFWPISIVVFCWISPFIQKMLQQLRTFPSCMSMLVHRKIVWNRFKYRKYWRDDIPFFTIVNQTRELKE